MLKKILILFSFLFLGFIFIPQMAFAQEGSFIQDMKAQTKAAGETGAELSKSDPRIVVANLIKVFLTTLAVLFIIYLIYGASLIFLSAGSEEKINEGKNTIKRAVFGLIIILNSYAITYYVTKFVQGDAGPCADGNCAVIEGNGDGFFNREKEKQGQANNFAPWECQDPNSDCVISP